MLDPGGRYHTALSLTEAARYFATASSRLKCIRSRPSTLPSDDRWITDSTSGLSPTSHTDTPRSRCPLLGFDQHLESGVLEIGHAAEIERHDLRLRLVGKRLHLLPDPLGIGEEDPPLESAASSRPGKVSSSGCSFGARPKDIRARLAPQHADRRIGRLVRQGHQRHHDGDEDPLQGPQQHDAGESGQGPDELRSSDLEDERGSPPAGSTRSSRR